MYVAIFDERERLMNGKSGTLEMRMSVDSAFYRQRHLLQDYIERD